MRDIRHKIKYETGDKVKVYSLQSFFDGGFINGTEGAVKQDQLDGGSVLVSVKRKIDGEYKIDSSYEVYPEQLRLIKKKSNNKPIKTRFEILDL